MLLNLMNMAHVPNCIMLVLLYMQSLMWFLIDLLSCSTITCVNNFFEYVEWHDVALTTHVNFV